jgi:hypothetical protein
LKKLGGGGTRVPCAPHPPVPTPLYFNEIQNNSENEHFKLSTTF